MSIKKSTFLSLQKKTRRQRAKRQTANERLNKHLAKITAAENQLKSEQAKGQSANRNRISRLSNQLNNLNNKTTDLRNNVSGIEVEIGNIIDRLIFSTDPRDQVAMLDDSYPVFLTPVRVETRFVTVKHIARIGRNRVPNVSPTYTIVNGRPVAMPINTSVSTVFNNVQEVPVIEDSKELWIRIFPDDIAVHTHENELTETESTAAKAFWNHIWRAGSNEGLRIGAWRALVGGRGPERAAWIAKQMTPTNINQKPSKEVKEDEDVEFEPEFPIVAQRDSTWTQAPHSRIMPDRFVARLYHGSAYREVVGEVVPDPLPLGIDPKSSTAEIENKDGAIELKDKIKWLQDFDEAEKVGMGIRVPLFSYEHYTGFSKILVLGVKTSADETEGKELLEELLNNHHYTHGGLSVVPQGTPTNNTEDGESGYTAYTANEEYLFDLEMGADRFTPTTIDKNKTDGQHLADALGINYDTVQHIHHADQQDVKEAMCMNRALWPVTLGYYLPQMMHPVFSKTEIERTKKHFNQYVLGRGRIPAIRVDDQPYGILPVTAFSKWQYSSNSVNNNFLGKMHNNVLKPMETTWQNLSAQVKVADPIANQGNVEKLFLDVLGLHASSVEYYQRFVTGPFLLWNIYNYSSIINSTIVNPTNASYASSLDFFQLFGDQDFMYAFPPRIFDFFYSQDHKLLNGSVIDKLKNSETRGLSALGTDGENYIDWLIKSNWYQIKNEDFSTVGNKKATPPNALLYLMLRHAALLEYNKTGLFFLANMGVVSELAYFDTEFINVSGIKTENAELKNMVMAGAAFKAGVKAEKKVEKRVEKEFIRRSASGELDGMDIQEIKTARTAFKKLLSKEETPKVMATASMETNLILDNNNFTASNQKLLFESQDFLNGVSVADLIADDLLKPKTESEFADMHELIDNLKCLKDMPTARLERCFAEHIDLANYRLDAWFYSLVLERLQKLRKSGTNRQQGIYLGAYAWLENLRKSDFEAIHYREIDIRPERILVPGISSVSIADDLNFNHVISGVKSFEFADNQSSSNSVTTPIVNASTSPISIGSTMLMLSNFDIADASNGNQGYIATGGNTLEINSTKVNIDIADPFIMNVPELQDFGPAYTYLGTDDIGPIMYDPITDRFINSPRVDPQNQGYIHAPSINHATTAAVLRAGYESHKLNTGSPDDALAININSERVRKAMYYLEGINNGQELGALLGYQFERGLHDRDIGLDAYILEIRTKYPFVAGRVTDSTGMTSVDTAEAYNVVNGLELIENSEDPDADYPYGIIGLPDPGAKKNAIITEIKKLHDAMDGINDLLMSEAMHQVVLGNYPKASAVLSAMGGNPLAIDPDVIKTPRNFDVVNHRIGCHFDLSAGGEQLWTTNGTPRSLAEPHLNRWLTTVLPDASNILINYQVQFFEVDGSPGMIQTDRLSIDDLEVEAIDLFYLLSLETKEGDSTAMLNRLNYHIRKHIVNADNVEVGIAFSDRSGLNDDQVTLFELQALIDELHRMVGNGRALRPSDYMLSDGQEEVVANNVSKGYDTTHLEARLSDLLTENMSNGQRGLQGLITDLKAGIATAATITEDPATATAGKLDVLRTALDQAAYFGVANAVPATSLVVDFETSTALITAATAVLTELIDRNNKADSSFTVFITLTEETAKAKKLEEIAQQILGRAFKVFPEFRLYNEGQVTAANNYNDYLVHVGENAIDEWLQGLSPVRKRIHAYHRTGLLAQAISGNDQMLDLSLSQIPLLPTDPSLNPLTRWVGVEYPEDYDLPDENISMLFYNPPGYNPGNLQAGILVDEWVEEIPHKTAHTGVSVHFNNPNSEPPQTCLLAVSPNLDGKWSWDDLMDTLDETLDWAKKRAVDPDLLNQSIYPQVLPAVYAAVSASDETPTLDFGRNVVEKPIHGVFGLIKLQEYYPIFNFIDLNDEND